MPARRPGRRDRIRTAFDELHALAGAALGAADRLRDQAAREHAETLAELWLRESGLDAARRDPQLSRVLDSGGLVRVADRVRADREAALTPWLEAGSPDRLSEIVEAAAPGVAGADPAGWLGDVGTVDAVGPVPELWQVGRSGLDGGPPFRVGVPLLDGAHLQISSDPPGRAAAEELVETLLVRVLSHFRPGTVGLHVWDVGQLRGSLPGLYPLTRTGLLTVHDPTAPAHLLDLLSDRIRRVHTRVLVGGHSSLRALADATGNRSEPWMVAVLLGNRQSLQEAEHRQLQRIARGGLACGISLVLVDVPVALSAEVETVTFDTPSGADTGRVRSSMTGNYLELVPDPHPGRQEVTRAATAIADAHEEQRGRLGPFRSLLPQGELLGESSRDGVVAPLGFDEGRPVDAGLDDATPHALVGGPSGSGKTNLLLTWITAMAARYSPDELELYMLDFKEGVSFAQFAPGPHSEEFLPQARLVGININTDREFGLALLQFLSEEMRRRADLSKRHGVTKLAELRTRLAEKEISERLPRIVAVIDEFQFLFSEGDAVTKEATKLLEDVARRGRSQGIHLVLASQDVAGIEAFWGRPAIFEQFVLRIALPRARRVLANLNDAAMEIPRHHAVVNTESGLTHGNEVVRIPDATTWDSDGRAVVDKVRDQVLDVVRERVPDPPRPIVFDGAHAPPHADLAAQIQRERAVPVTMVGQAIEVHGNAAAVELPNVPGRNLGVIAAGADDAVKALGSAAAVLGGQQPGATYHLADLVPGVGRAVRTVERLVRAADPSARCHPVKPPSLRETIDTLADTIRTRQSGGGQDPVFLVLFGADAGDGLLERQGTESLRTVLHHGPENGVHVLGWWRSAQRLKSLLGLPASMDDLGAWIALDVQGSELNSFAPGLGLVWAPRPGRGLFFDRARHSRPQVVFVPDFPLDGDEPGTEDTG